MPRRRVRLIPTLAFFIVSAILVYICSSKKSDWAIHRYRSKQTLTFNLEDDDDDYNKSDDYDSSHFYRDDGPCRGWDPVSVNSTALGEDDDPVGCWRAVMYRQLEKFDVNQELNRIDDELTQHNQDRIENLKRCLLDMSSGTGANSTCPPQVFRVILGQWWYFALTVKGQGTSGEVVWLNTQLQILREQGYTILASLSYVGMIDMYRQIPDVIHFIWTVDEDVISCQADPRCIDFATFRPTKEVYPQIQVNDQLQLNSEGRIGFRWIYNQDDLDGIPTKERGVIPLWKLFAITYWGAGPGNGYWQIPDDGKFSFNPLGLEWILSPFPYPQHTHLPYTLEDDCLSSPMVPHEQRSERMVILGKQADFFYGGTVSRDQWQRVTDETQLQCFSTANEDSEDLIRGTVPAGVVTIGQVSRTEYDLHVAKSKLMLGIGWPLISPSVYVALCQGVPVVLPKYVDTFDDVKPWDIYNGRIGQHGPAQLLGPPYVYSYKRGNIIQAIDAINAAKSTPIERFIPPEMTWTFVRHAMAQYLSVDWQAKASDIIARNGGRYPIADFNVVKHCYNMRRCYTYQARLEN